MAVDLAQGGIAARFGRHDHAIDALDKIELDAQALGRDAFGPDPGRGEMLLDRRDSRQRSPSDLL